MQERLMNLLSLGGRVVAGALLVFGGCAGVAQDPKLRFDRALAKSPPAVERATLELMPSATERGNAILRVVFADKRSKTTVVIDNGFGATALRDDGVAPDAKSGDGVYTAIVNANAEQFAKEQERRASLARTAQATPVFRLRELIGYEPLRGPQTLRLISGVEMVLEKFHGYFPNVDAPRELMIRNTLVIEDPMRTFEPCNGTGTPMGAWTFGRLMTEIANEPATGIHPADFVENWFNQWKTVTNINGFSVFPRAIGTQRFLDRWPRTPDGRLDLAKAPFRLLAIVNRQDLRGSSAYGGGDAGEARLVFGAVMCPLVPPAINGEALGFTVIFEYGVPRSGCFAVRDWAQQWHALGGMAPGSVAYNSALQAITDQFTLRDANPARLPNRSAINQVRSNEFELANFPADTFWEMRESKLQSTAPSAGQLQHMTTAQTPGVPFSGSTVLGNYINAEEASILAGTHEVPLSYPAGTPFRAGAVELGAGRKFDAPGILNSEARHLFSLATCSACHTDETRTHFVHIAPRLIGAEAQLSNFLTGANMPIADPVSGVPRTFNELLARRVKLDATVNMSCARKRDFAIDDLFIEPLAPAFVH
jgi:hypothetical protein